MAILVRAIALLLAVGVMAAPVSLSLFIASVEPSRPVRLLWVAPFAVGGLVAAAGYWAVAITPRRLAVAALEIRIVVACLMGVPCAVAIYLLSVTGSNGVMVFCLLALAGTALLFAACVWPAWIKHANPMLKRTADGSRLH